MTYISPQTYLMLSRAARSRGEDHHADELIRLAGSRLATAAWIARRALGERNSIPVEFAAGATEPHIEGEGWHFRTRGGTYVRHPSAYSRRGWSNLVYHASTRRIVVGRDWPALAMAGRPRAEIEAALSTWGAALMEMRALAPAAVTTAEIVAAHNEEYRRGLIAVYGDGDEASGMARLAAGGSVIGDDETGTLVELPTAGEPMRMVAVTCPTTGRRYALRVPPQTASAREGVAWTFGVPAALYQPTAQS